MVEDTIITAEYSHLSTSILNAIRLEIIQHTECWNILECKVLEWTCVLPVEVFISNLSACPILEIAALDNPDAGIVDRVIHRGHIRCSWDSNNVDKNGMTVIYTRDVTLSDGIRFIHDDISIISLKEGESMYIEFVVTPGTAYSRGPNCDPTSVVAIRDFDRCWLSTTYVDPPIYRDIVEHRLLDVHILCTSNVHTIEASISNTTTKHKVIYAEDLSFGQSVHILSRPPNAEDSGIQPRTILCELRPNDTLTIRCNVMQPTNNVLIIETVGMYSSRQLINAAMKRLKSKMFE